MNCKKLSLPSEFHKVNVFFKVKFKYYRIFVKETYLLSLIFVLKNNRIVLFSSDRRSDKSVFFVRVRQKKIIIVCIEAKNKYKLCCHIICNEGSTKTSPNK